MIWAVLIGLFFVAMWLIEKFAPPSAPEPWKIQPPPGLALLTADDSAWRELILKYCESPAESAFLEAMIAGYGLRPERACLRGGGLSLAPQVKMPPYRVDFLADDWLVVEIDGAAYHSSPEAVESDRNRDEYLLTKGYATLRIPARVVLDNAREAVRRVQAAIAGGPPESVRRVRESIAAMAATTTTKSSGFIASRYERVMDAAVAGDKACDDMREFLNAESSAISHALVLAEIDIDAETYAREPDPGRRAAGLESIRSRQRSFESLPPFKGLSPDRLVVLTRAVLTPPVHPDRAINREIKRTYRALLHWRELGLAQARRKIGSNPRLGVALEARLERMGYRISWEAISTPRKNRLWV